MIPLTSRDSRPVWDQVSLGLLGLLEKGAFLPGEAPPDPKELAWQLVVNPAAVRRAYEALERLGYLERNDQAAYRVAERRDEPC